MKKLLALVLAAVMALSMVPALAETTETITLNFVESKQLQPRIHCQPDG